MKISELEIRLKTGDITASQLRILNSLFLKEAKERWYLVINDVELCNEDNQRIIFSSKKDAIYFLNEIQETIKHQETPF